MFSALNNNDVRASDSFYDWRGVTVRFLIFMRRKWFEILPTSRTFSIESLFSTAGQMKYDRTRLF